MSALLRGAGYRRLRNWYSTTEAARALGISTEAVTRRCERGYYGDWDSRRRGSRWQVRASAVEAEVWEKGGAR